MKRFNSVQAIFFDLDDTLCAYWNASKAGMRAAFEKHGPKEKTPDEMIAAWAKAFKLFSPSLKNDPEQYKTYCKSGEPTRTEQMRRTLDEVGIVDEQMACRLSESYMIERDANLRLFDDAIDVLSCLKRSYRLGLITNGPADVQRQEIATTGIEHFFDPILIEGEMNIGKPEAEVFRVAQQAVCLPPENLLFVGNSYAHDIRPAIEAGWHTAWIRRDTDLPPTSSRIEQKPEGGPDPDVVIHSLSELLDMLPVRV